MTRPTPAQRRYAARLDADLSHLATQLGRIQPPALEHVLAHAADCAGAAAWGSGSDEVAVATSGISDPTQRRALTGFSPPTDDDHGRPDRPTAGPKQDQAVRLARLLTRLAHDAHELANLWPTVMSHIPAEQLDPPTCACGCGRPIPPATPTRRGMLDACRQRQRRASHASQP